ncbi:tRNA (adenosine(37)-N6)-threonylcarbamoyltransferase complex dimerization subunit type 1 TsaB [Larkinella terrae]|uniref:tRNA (Adenosine(37)-N6)-threonylcarbamoyltransferase complex dimerization subunit type 1 TsaB n=1 Tax=Larkinella terrae TaxID=2025311 RepID=A0A7K0EHK7_9BACT|nr:tRNA (adenosine(37)-N6)-threonylcarbamoyltransferase complex dimerization subunit type 1 TsaB [Larkinella terrae]MRS61274.1 tRNA (adenosine(37)-N6)-threonylcarbamoyltransferase complex dimerization subunit type 1 TsaB [Larkinella terrae]
MLILSLDTSTTVCSVALHHDGAVVACYELFTEKSSSGMLTTLIQNAVQQSGYPLSDLDAVAVAKGPGSYTGLRIGVSTAKGLCFALDKPLLAINTLEAMAHQLSGFYPRSYALCPLLDARRMEVYGAVYDSEGREIRPTSAQIIDEQSFADLLAEQPVVFFGNGAAKCRAVLSHQPNAVFPDSVVHPSAKTVGKLAALAYTENRFENVADFEPYYLKDFVGTKPKKLVV